ncbi:MAG: MFS transporter [Bryobacterales bacterium]|nr:MFS transporter [Bryobacterales bacterium]
MRHWVVGGLFVLSLITYIDRAAISSVKDPLAAELHLTDREMGAVFSAFALGYALAQIPSGWAADRFGPRAMLSGLVVFWSLLTALTGAVHQFFVLLAVRFTFGLAEAGAFPGSARAFYNWLPPWEHGRANGIIFAASRLGAAIAFPVMAWLLERASWREAFYWLAMPGIVWGIGWYALFRDEPAVPPQRAERPAGAELSFGEIFRSRPMLLAMSQYFIVNFTTFLCLTWMLPYLKQRFALSSSQAAFYAMIPLLVGATAQWATGTMVDRLYRSRHRSWSRRLPAMAGFLLSAAGIFAIPQVEDVRAVVALFTIAAFGAEMTISPSWAFCMDIGGKKSGAISGAINMLGNLGSFVSANLFPVLGPAYFTVVMLLNLYSAVAWYFMRPRDEAPVG